MLGHYLHLAIRNVPRAGPFVLISILGLAIGLGAALLIGLYVNDELGYERWLPDSDRVYLISVRSPAGGMTDNGPSDIRAWLESEYPQFEAVTRLSASAGFFKRDEHEFNERVFWADPNFLDVFRFPVVAGTLEGALNEPDTLVLTRRHAEKYFGRPDPLGETLVLDGKHAMTVTAVIDDLPSNTHFEMDVIAAGLSRYSPMADQDVIPMTVVGAKSWAFWTYGLLERGEAITASLRESIRTLPDRHSERAAGGQAASEVWPLDVRQIRSLHLGARNVASPDSENLSRLYGVMGIGALIIFAAAINFVTLRTALAMRRALEVGVRKACGGSRGALFAQFMAEVFAHVCVATVLGIAIAAAALPALNALLLRTIEWQTLLSPPILGGIALLIAAITLLAGSYPAFVLASFRPSVVTKARSTGRLQNGVRQGLVGLQFAIVIAVLIATIVVHRQTAFGMRESLRQLDDPTLVLRSSCSDALRDALSRLPGVKGAACSAFTPQTGAGGVGPVQYKGSERLVLGEAAVDFGFFELYGIELAAGRYFSEDFADETPIDLVWTSPESIMLNEAGVKMLGIASPHAAIGEVVTINHPSGLVRTFSGEHAAQIVGVVQDFQMGSVRNEVFPFAFWVDPLLFRVLSLKLDGRTVPETLDAIDRVWAEVGDPGPPERWFVEDQVEQLYRDLRRDFELFSVAAGVAILISALGLVGLAAHAAAARTKEIGVRKVLGSGRAGIMGLLLWQFGRPVLLANIIAWPAAYLAMSRWLEGFARRIDLEPWMFAGAALATILVAAATVGAHAWSIAGIRPVVALRRE